MTRIANLIYLVAGVEPADGVGGEVAGAEGVAAAGHVLPHERPRLHDFQVGLQVGLLAHAGNVGKLVVIFVVLPGHTWSQLEVLRFRPWIWIQRQPFKESEQHLRICFTPQIGQKFQNFG